MDEPLTLPSLAGREAVWDLETEDERLAVLPIGPHLDSSGGLQYTATIDPATRQARMYARGFVLYSDYRWQREDFRIRDDWLVNGVDGDGDSDPDDLVSIYLETVTNPSFDFDERVVPPYKLIEAQPELPMLPVQDSQIDARVAPVAVADTFWMLHDGSLIDNLLTNDLQVRGPIQVAHLGDQFFQEAAPLHGTVTVAPNGLFQYQPDPGYVGDDYFSYTITDGVAEDSRRAYVVVENSSPVAIHDGVHAVLHGQPFSSNLLSNDLDLDGDAMQIEIAGAVVDPATPFTVISLAGGELLVSPNGDYTYTPFTHDTGVVNIPYTISDGAAADTAMIQLAYYNHPPLVRERWFTFPSGASAYTATLSADDSDGDPLTYSPSNLLVFAPPASDWTGQVPFFVTVTDDGGVSNTVEITLEVIGPDSPPSGQAVAVDDAFIWSGCEGKLQKPDFSLGNGLSNDSTDRPPLRVVAVAPSSAAFGNLVIDEYGSATYTIHEGMADALFLAGPDRFTYTIEDAEGNQDTAVVEVDVRILQAGQSLYCGPAVLNNGGPAPIAAWFDGAAFARAIGSGAYQVGVSHANLDWDGDASSLLITASDGTVVSQVDISGELTVHAQGGTAKHLKAGIIEYVGAFGRIESVTATDRIEVIYGVQGVGKIRAVNDIELVIAPYHNDVDSVVSAAGHVSAVYSATGNVGEVKAGKSIGFVLAPGDITGDIRAREEDIGYTHLTHDWVDVGLAEYEATYPGTNTQVRGIYAMGSIEGHVAAGRDITVVYAGTAVRKTVTADRDLLLVRAENGTIDERAAIRAGNDLYTVDAELSVNGPSSAGRYLGVVRAGQDITARADIAAGTHVGGVLAGGSLSADVRAATGSITNVTAGDSSGAGGISHATLYANMNIGEVSAIGGGIGQTSIRAANGYLGNVTTTGFTDTEIEAGASVGTVTGTTFQLGSILSQRSSIEGVTMTVGDLNATVTAALHVGPVFARQSIKQPIRGDAVLDVRAELGDIQGAVTGLSHVGNVRAGRDVQGAVTAGTPGSGLGNIGRVIAGEAGAGDITGAVNAGRDIYLVQAKGGLDNSGYQPIDSVATALYQSGLTAWLADPSATAASIPRPPRAAAPPVGAVGTVGASVTAGHNIGAVLADRDIQEKPRAGQSLYLVAARGTVAQGAAAGWGALTVIAGRETHGAIEAPGHVFVHSYGNSDASVESGHGVVVVDGWHALSGTYTGPAGVHAAAYEDITSPTIASSAGPIGLGSYHNIAPGTVDGAVAVAGGALGRFTGHVTSRDGDVFAAAVDKIDAQIDAKRQAAAASLSAIEGSIIGQRVAAKTFDNLSAATTAAESVRLYVRYNLSGHVTSTAGDVYVNAGTISGSTISAPLGFVGLDVYGDFSGNVTGGEGVTASVLGGVSGDVASPNGGVLVLADRDVSGSITAGDDRTGIGLVSWGSVSASLTAANGPVVVAFSHGNVSGPIQAGKEVLVNTWGSITTTVHAGDDALIVARRNVSQPVTAGRDVRVTAGGNVGGAVNADRDALVYANADISGHVTGGRDATVDALGAVTANVTATAGEALVSALGNYQGQVTAGRHAIRHRTDTHRISRGSRQMLHFRHHTPLLAPTVKRAIGNLHERPRRFLWRAGVFHRLLRSGKLRGHLTLGVLHLFHQPCVARHPDDKPESGRRFTPTHQTVVAEMPVTADGHADVRPGLANSRHDLLQQLHRSGHRTDVARPQLRGQQKLAAKNVLRQITVAVVMLLKMAAQLIAEQVQIGRVDVERDFRRRLVMRVEKQIDQQVGQAAQIGDDFAIGRIGVVSDLGQLEPIQRTLAGHRHAAIGLAASLLAFQILLADAGGDQRIGPQAIVIIQIFVSQTEPIDSLSDEIEYGMLDEFWIPMIGKAAGVPFQHAKHPIDLGDQRHASIADNISALKIGGQDPLAEPVKFDRYTVFARGNLHDLS